MNLENMLNNKIKFETFGVRRFSDGECARILFLGVGEPDFDTPWHIRQKRLKRYQKAIFYTVIQG